MLLLRSELRRDVGSSPEAKVRCKCSDVELSQECKFRLFSDLDLVAGGSGLTSLAYDLSITITKRDKIGSSLPGGGDERPMLYNVMASETLTELTRVLRRVAWQMVTVYPHLDSPAGPTEIARWLKLLPGLLTTNDYAPQMAHSIREAVSSAQSMIDRPAEKKFLGTCNWCSKALYVKVDSNGDIPDVYIECCGVETSAQDLREDLLQKLHDQVAPANRIVGLVNEITGEDVSSDAIRAMKRRNPKLEVRGKSSQGADLFRVGDVIHILTLRARARLSQSEESQ